MQAVASLALALALAFSTVNAQVSPRGWTPIEYNVSLDLSNMQISDTFQGKVAIRLRMDVETSSIVLDVDDAMNVTKVKVMSKGWGDKWDTEETKNITKENSTVIIRVSQTLDKDEHVVTMEFAGNYQSSLGGLTKLKIGSSYMGVASLEPNYAHRMFPCYDDPQFRAKVILDLVVQNSETVITSLPTSETSNLSDSLVKLRFSNIPPIAVHQLGFLLVNESTIETRTYNTTTKEKVNIFTRSLRPFGNQTEWGTEVAALMATAMVNFTGQAFPFNKLEQFVLPQVESNPFPSWGLISYSEEDFLVLENQSPTQDKQKLVLLLAERFAEQYFGGVITTDWNDSWLVKGFSQYLKYMVPSDLVPEFSSSELSEQMIVDMLLPALALNISGQSLNIKATHQSDQIQAAYSDLNIYKGAAVLRMVHKVMGDQLFRDVIRYFINTYQYQVIKPSSLWELLYKAARASNVDLAGKSMQQVMEDWVDKPGQPTLSVTRNRTHFIISQGSGSWHVRVSYSLQANPHKVQEVWLLPGDNVTVSASGNEWILVNINQTSFCRVNYSSELSSEIIRQLKTDLTKIPRMMRAQLLNDAFSLWMEGYLLTDTLLDCLGYLNAETDYYAWKTALRNYISVMNRFNGFPAYSLLKNYMLNLLEKVISDVGMESTQKDTQIDKLRRSLILENACLFGHPKCQTKASSILASWSNQTMYDPDLNTALLCAGVANSSSDVWQSVQTMYATSTLPGLRAHLLPSLACSRDPQLIKRFIVNIIMNSTNKEKHIVFKKLATTPVGSNVLFNLLLDSLYFKLNRTRNETEGNPTTEQPATEYSPTEDPDNTTYKMTRDMKEEQVIDHIEGLSNEDIIHILTELSQSLTHLDNGTQLEALAKNDSGLLEVTDSRVVESLMNTITQVYEHDKWARNRNGEIQIWLEKAQEPTSPKAPPSGSTDAPPSTPGAAATIVTNAFVYLLTLAVLLRHLS